MAIVCCRLRVGPLEEMPADGGDVVVAAAALTGCGWLAVVVLCFVLSFCPKSISHLIQIKIWCKIKHDHDFQRFNFFLFNCSYYVL